MTVSTGLQELWNRSNGKCFYCCCMTILTTLPIPRQATRDHLVPRAKGGKGGANIVLACFSCNNSKGDQAEPPKGPRKIPNQTRLEPRGEPRNRIKAQPIEVTRMVLRGGYLLDK